MTLPDVSTTCDLLAAFSRAAIGVLAAYVAPVGIITSNGAYFRDLFVSAPLTSRSVIIIGRPEQGGLEA